MTALGKRHIKQLRRALCVIIEELIEITHTIKKQLIRVIRF